jgi:nitroreductase
MVDKHIWDTLFLEARTYNGWQDKPVEDALLQAIYDKMKWGATSANCSPLRIIFAKSTQAKEKLKSALDGGNVQKTMGAPVCAIFVQDMAFYEKLPQLFPHADAKSWFVGNQSLIEATAARNSSLQAAYFMLAARLHGLDCGPMSGFDAAKVKEAFFPEQAAWQANFLCNLGYGDTASLYPRLPRLAFEDVSKIV